MVPFGNQISGESPQPFLSRYNNNFDKSADVDGNHPPKLTLERLYPSLPTKLQRESHARGDVESLRVQKGMKTQGRSQRIEMENEFMRGDQAVKN